MLPKVVNSILLTLCVLQTVTAFKRTNIKFNKNTGGYKDIVVVINEELSAASCPQILDNVKVCGFWYTYHRNYLINDKIFSIGHSQLFSSVKYFSDGVDHWQPSVRQLSWNAKLLAYLLEWQHKLQGKLSWPIPSQTSKSCVYIFGAHIITSIFLEYR